MSEKVLAKDAKAGQWYECRGSRVLCCDKQRIWTREMETSIIGKDVELTHLPDCTGWDWQPPKPKPKYRPFANAAEFMPHRERWVIEDHRVYKILRYDDKGFETEESIFDYDEAFDLGDLTFDDGSPFGVEVTK